MLIALLVVGSGIAAPARAQDQFPGMVVSTDWLGRHLNAPQLRVFQVGMSDDSTYGRQHIPGAQFLLLDSIAEAREGKDLELRSPAALRGVLQRLGVSDSSWVVIYGAPVWLAARSFFTLDYVGLPHVAVLNGGLSEWTDEGRRVTADVPHYSPGSVTVGPRAAVVDADWVKAHLSDPHLVLFDTRSDSEYQGIYRHRGLDIKGHIPGARLVHWQALVRDTTGGDLFLQDSTMLAGYYRQRASAVDSVVTYCHVGARASISYLVARYLGYAVKLYDGSYEDWAAHGYEVRASTRP